MNDLLEPWEIWFLKWRGSELARLVCRLAEVLLARGECTADSIRSEPLDGDPRIRGAAMKAICRLGLATMEPLAVKSASGICHHRPIQRFLVLDVHACRALTEHFENDILQREEVLQGVKVDHKNQMLLNV